MQPPFWLELEGAVNARDVGGLGADGGRTTRRGVLIRSDAVHQLTDTDVALLTGTFGIRHVIDLRAEGERAEHARGLLGRTSVTYSELDILTDAMIAERRAQREAALASGDVDPASIIAEGYHQLLEFGRDAFVTALRRLAEPDGTPSLVHCSAGKDRTGVLVAMLLDAAGVSRDAIVADYAATDLRMARVLERLAAMPQYTQLAAQTPAMLLAAHAATMDRFLDRLHSDFGGAAQWFLAAGVSPDELNRWQDLILTTG
jgi:protein tyrosine/serine phosphatase